MIKKRNNSINVNIIKYNILHIEVGKGIWWDNKLSKKEEQSYKRHANSIWLRSPTSVPHSQIPVSKIRSFSR